jgi:hypothetical protein
MQEAQSKIQAASLEVKAQLLCNKYLKITELGFEVPLCSKNSINSYNFTSMLSASYKTETSHNSIFELEDIGTLWSDVKHGTAIIKQNGIEYVYNFLSNYAMDRQILTIMVQNIELKPIILRGEICIVINFSKYIVPTTPAVEPSLIYEFSESTCSISR